MLNTRERLIEVAAQIFVEKGYAQATTREICLAANTNITSIHYYFGSKKDLYRAIFSEPFKNFPKLLINTESLLNKTPRDALNEFYRVLLMPFIEKRNRGCRTSGNKNLHFMVHDLIHREQFEPTGLVDDLIIGPAKHIHEPLLQLLCKFLGVQEVSDEMHRLGFAIVGLGFSLVHPQHIVNYYAPNLLAAHNMDLMYDRLVDYALALITSMKGRVN